MKSPLALLSRTALIGIAEALETGKMTPPYGDLLFHSLVPGLERPVVATEVQRLAQSGMQPVHLAYVFRLLAAERESNQRASDRVELVWSGPESGASYSRDTGVVMRELFGGATHSVLVSGFVLYHGKQVLQTLAERMAQVPGLSVRMFLNVARVAGDQTVEAELLQQFAHDFLTHQWPGSAHSPAATRLPEVFYDPRALAMTPGPRASLHAKCVIVDDEQAFVTSANLTEAAQERNIEAGVLIRDSIFARNLRSQFENLVASGGLRRLPGIC